jgi:hypothetical protein
VANRVISKQVLLWCGFGLACLNPSVASAMRNGQSMRPTAEAGRWPKTGVQIAQKDRIEISDLLARYTLYADAANGDAFAAMFTEDGELIFSGRTIKGRADLAKHISAKMRRTLHLAGAPLLAQIAPGHMRVQSELLYIAEAPQASPSASQPAPQTIGFRMYDDDIVLAPQGWKFARREARATIPLSPEFLPTLDIARTRVR